MLQYITCAKTVGAKAAGEASCQSQSFRLQSHESTVRSVDTPFNPSDRPNGNPTTCSRECTAGFLNDPTKTGPVTKVAAL